MKYLTTFLLVAFAICLKSNAQSVGISNEEITPHPSAALEIRTSEKGLLIPRLSAAEKASIQDPAVGLLVYQSDLTNGFYYFDGTDWVLIGEAEEYIDNDPDPTNEIQSLSLVGDTLYLSDANFILLPDGGGFTDHDEQTLSLNGDTLTISNGNFVVLETASNVGWNHNATQNIQLNSFYLTADGDNEGLRLSTSGNAEFSNNLSVDGETTVNNLVVDGNADLGTGAIQSDELDAASVTTTKIADNTITTAKIQDAQITASKLHPMGASTDQFLKYNGSTWTPATISTGLIYLGTWDASTNTPVISDATGQNGNFYIVSTAGSQNLGSGAISFEEGDWAIHNGSNYEKVNNSNDVNSVFGRTGIVTAQYGDYAWSQINLTNSSIDDITDINSTTMPAGNLLISDGSQWVSSAISGDASLTSGGSLQISNGAIGYDNIQDATGASNTIISWDGTQWEEVLFSSLEGDASASNEIQSLSLVGTNLSISSGNTVNLSTLSGVDTDDQTLDLTSNILSIVDGNSVDLSGYLDNTDAQQLSFVGTELSIGNGNTVDLASLSTTDTDDQTLTLSTNTLSISEGNSVDLSGYLDNTDAQSLSLVGTDLSISNGNTVDLSPIDTDEQTLGLVGATLSITNGNSVDLSALGGGTGTDDQTLNISNDTLYIEDGNAVFLGPYLDNTDDQTLSINPSDMLIISDGNNVSLGPYLDNTDEQTLSLVGTDLSISGGNTVDISSINTDAQNLAYNGTTHVLSLTGGATTVDLSGLQDNLGNHILGTNLSTDGNFISGAGGDTGIFVNNLGHVSIGEDKPDYKLHLTKATDAILRIDNNDPAVDGIIQLAMNALVSPTGNDFIQFIDGNGSIIGSIDGNGSTVNYNTTSDIRLKDNLIKTNHGLNTILNVKVYDYNYKGSELPQTGFSAQQLYTVFPPAVSVGGENPKTDPWSIDYSKLTPVLTQAIQDLNDKVTDLEKENEALKKKVKELEALAKRIEKIEKLLAE